VSFSGLRYHGCLGISLRHTLHLGHDRTPQGKLLLRGRSVDLASTSIFFLVREDVSVQLGKATVKFVRLFRLVVVQLRFPPFAFSVISFAL
jgi:hypothetical protein